MAADLAPDLAAASATIAAYTFGMDTADWDLAVAQVAEALDVDYRAVGGPSGRMARADLRAFLAGLLGKPDLRVHTAVGQVLPHPDRAGEFVAYYSVRHFKGAAGQARQFAVYGWYRFALTDGHITALAVDVSAMEGDPSVLA